jgi:hypothetical protein
MPYALVVYSAEDWLRPGDDPDDEQAARAAYIRHVEARDLWSADYAHMVVARRPGARRALVWGVRRAGLPRRRLPAAVSPRGHQRPSPIINE